MAAGTKAHIVLKPQTILRILRDKYFAPGLRQTYWNANAFAAEIGRLFRPDNMAFRRHVLQNQLLFLLNAVRPIEGQTLDRARAAVTWLLRAQQVTPDSGVALGYFPCGREREAWRSSYPETTGYIITSLLAYADRFSDAKARDAALAMARWEVDIQMSSGAVQGGPVCPAERQTPAAFNTGMVLDGWCSAFAAARESSVLEAARRAADFLVNDLDGDGYFRTNGAFVSAGEIKTFSCLCAWAMYRFGDISGEERYGRTATKCIEAALRQQRSNGWFAHNCLARSDAPLTHTIGYTLQGILEVGVLAKREDFIAAVRRCVDEIIPRASNDGYLPGVFYSDWEPAGFSSCLTGAAQIAVVCYRLSEETRRDSYRLAADRLLNFLKPLQVLDSPISAINGAIPGSFPMLGEYMRAGYPNWATKYYLDALLLQDRCSRRSASRRSEAAPDHDSRASASRCT